MKTKILIAIITVVLVFNPLIRPSIVNATGIPVVDIASFLQKIWTEIIRPALLATLKKQVLDVMVDQIITYIQGGGKPKFVSDWKEFAEDAGQVAVGELAKEAELGFLCSPFSLQIQLALLPVETFSQRSDCTLDDIIGNVQAFQDDFRNGGWIAYGSAWQPQNTFYGALLIAAQELENRRGAAALAAVREGLANGGFLSVKDAKGNIVTPGKLLGDLTTKAVGSDIDYIINAQDLGAYVAAIADALINRVIKEGFTGLQKTSSQGKVGTANAQLEASIISNAFEPMKNNLIAQINEPFIPRQRAESAIDSTVNALGNFKDDLNKISSDFANIGRSTCSAGQIIISDVRNQISSEIAQADAYISQFLADRADNRIFLDQLESALNEVNQLPANRIGLARLNEINNEINSILDPTAALDFQSAIESEATAINQFINQKTRNFQDKLATCIVNP